MPNLWSEIRARRLCLVRGDVLASAFVGIVEASCIFRIRKCFFVFLKLRILRRGFCEDDFLCRIDDIGDALGKTDDDLPWLLKLFFFY